MSPLRLLRKWLVLGFVLSLTASTSRSQITNVTNDQATPIPGVGHDYIKMFNETVNPANGQVSLRVDMGTPAGRRLNHPLALLYNSAGVHHVGNFSPSIERWLSDGSRAGGAGWYYSFPQLTAIEGFTSTYNPTANPPTTYTCEYISNYILQDVAGTRHSLNISIGQWGGPGTTNCDQAPQPVNQLYGAEGSFIASTVAPQPGYGNFFPSPVAVADPDGTVYYFSHFSYIGFQPSTTGYYALPDYIEDRNGRVARMTNPRPFKLP